MLTDKEKTECRLILSSLENENLRDLVCTLTKINTDLVSISKDDAVNFILNEHTGSPKDLLSRKKVTKNALLNYCTTAKMHVPVTDMNKGGLVKAIIKYWKRKLTLKKPKITPPPAPGQELQANSIFPQSPQNYNQSDQSVSSSQETPHSQPASTIGSMQQDIQLETRSSETDNQEHESKIRKLEQDLEHVRKRSEEDKNEYEKKIEIRDNYIKQLQLELEDLKKKSN